MLTRNDIEIIVDKLDMQGLIRKGKITSNWYTIHCPFHNNGNERKPSCGVLLEDEVRGSNHYHAGMFHCFACGASKNLEQGITEILKMKAITDTGSKWLQENVPGYESSEIQDKEKLIGSSIVQGFINKFAIDSLKLRTQAAKPSYISEEELASYRYTVPYMYERKLTDAVIDRYDVGFDANHIPPGRSKSLPCITFPVRDAFGNTLFICRRSIEGKYFNYPTGVVKPVYGLYELPQNCKSVIICESIFNALTANVYGYNAVALLGTGDPYQIDQLKKLGVSEYIICLDGDEAGRKGTAKLQKALKGSAMIWTIHMPDGKDVNDCTKPEFDELYSLRD